MGEPVHEIGPAGFDPSGEFPLIEQITLENSEYRVKRLFAVSGIL